MAEKEEEFKKKDEEKKEREEKEERERDQKLRAATERLRQERPKHLEELRKMNLDTSPIKELKGIMEKMCISSRGCISRKDLKEKLLESVPELRLEQLKSPDQLKDISGESPLLSVNTTSQSCFYCIGGQSFDPLGSIPISDEVKGLKEELAQTKAKLRTMTDRADKAENSLHPLESQVASLQNQVATLKTENSTLRTKSSSSNNKSSESQVTALKKQVATLRAEISSLRSRPNSSTRSVPVVREGLLL